MTLKQQVFLNLTTFYTADTEDIKYMRKMHILMQQRKTNNSQNTFFKIGGFEEFKYKTYFIVSHIVSCMFISSFDAFREQLQSQ